MRDQMIAIRLTVKEREAINEAAAAAELGPTTWIRLMALAAAGASSLEADAKRAKRKANKLRKAASLLTLLALASSSACGGPDYGSPRVCATQAAILNGTEAGELEQWATVRVGKGCSGVLVAPDVVLTAAHCNEIAFYITTHAGETVPVWDRIMHPNYAGNWFSDIEVLILEHDVITAAPVAVSAPRLGSATSTGFGLDETGAQGVLRTATIEFDAINQFAALSPPGDSDSCYGDSGGGIYQNGMLVALTATGRNGGGCGNGSVNTTPDAFADWIDTVTGGAVEFSEIGKCN